MSKFNVKKSLTTKFDQFEADRLTFTPLEDNERSKGQKISYPRYNHPEHGEGQALFLQGPWMQMYSYGVPTLGEYYKEDKDRAFVKVPLDLNNPEVKKMVEEFDKVDAVLSSEDYKKEQFGKNAKKYEYQPIVRYPLVDEEEENTKPPYMKLKLDLTWPDSNVKTEVFTSELMEDGKRSRNKVDLETVTEFASNLSYMSNFRPVFRPVKLWAHQAKMKDPGYGIVFKLIKVEVEPNKNSNSSVLSYLQGDVFIDDEDEEVVEAQSSTVVEEVKDVKKVDTKKVVEDSDSDSDSDSSDDDSDSEEQPPKKVATKKGKSKKSSA